jgi:hypothetical protein
MHVILIIVVLLFLFGGLGWHQGWYGGQPPTQPGQPWGNGYYYSGGLGLVVIVLIVLFLLGYL